MTDLDLMQRNTEALRLNQKALALRVSREHYIALAEQVYLTQIALDESVKLQSHYAELLNLTDGGKRLTFLNGEDWINRLKEIGRFGKRPPQ